MARGTMLRTLMAATVTAVGLGSISVGHAVELANIDVVDGAAPTNTTPPTVSIPGGQSTAGFFIDAGAVVGEYPIRIGASAADDAAGGILLVTPRETGRLPVDGPAGAFGLTATPSIVADNDVTSLNTRNVSGGLAIVTDRAGSNNTNGLYPVGGAMNANVAAAYFPFSEGWVGGTVSSTLNDNPLDTFFGTPGITFSPIIGPTNTSNIRPNFYGAGQTFVSLPGVSDTRQQGLLFAIHAKNEDNMALVSPNADGDGWNVMTHNNSTDGVATGEANDPFSFVFLPVGTPNVTMASIWGAGSGAAGDPMPVLKSGGNFTITREATGPPGYFRLSIPGQSPSTGALIVNGGSNLNGAGGLPGDNVVTYRADGNDWLIISDDGPTINQTAGQNGQSGESVPYFQFAFMPFNSPPTAPAAVPPPVWNKSSVVGFQIHLTELSGIGNDNDDFIKPAVDPDPGLNGPDVYGTVVASNANLNVVPSNMNRGDNRNHINGAYPTPADGVMLASIREGLRDNSTTGGINDYGIVSVSPAGNQWKVSVSGAGSTTGEANIDYSVAFFGANSGFTMGAYVTTGAAGMGTLSISGVNSLTDGVLMVNASAVNAAAPATAVANHEDNFVVMNPKLDGSGWDVLNQDNGVFTQANTSFAYVYLPYNTQNLVAGSVNPNGSLVASTPTSAFTLVKEGTGSYLLTINGRTPSQGTLLLVAGNGDANSQDNAMVYEPAGNSFRILGVDLITNAEGEGGGFTTLEDSGFQFAFIDYITPPVAPSTGFLEADFNQDTFVNTADFNAFKGGFGTSSGASKAQGDSNGDGDVDGGDFLKWQQQFGASSAAVASSVGVPEPGAATLAALVAACLAATGRRRK